MKKYKLSWFVNLIIFLLVPVSQVLLYIFSPKSITQVFDLLALKDQTKLSTEQFSIFQLFMVVVVSIGFFAIIFCLDWVIMRLLAPKFESEALFISLVISIIIGSLVGIFLPSVLDLRIIRGIVAIVYIFVIVLSYSLLSRMFGGSRDKIGTVLLGIIHLALGIIPFFIV